MKKATVPQGWPPGRRLGQAGKQLSVDRVVGHFQTALLCVDQFGFYGALILGLVGLASFLLQAARSVAEKGVISMIDPRAIRRRAARFLRERYEQRERPGYFAELFLWTLVVIIAAWPLSAVVHAVAMLK